MAATSQKINGIQTFGPDGLVPCLNDPETNVHEVNYLWEIEDINEEYCDFKASSKNGHSSRSEIFNSATDDECKWYLEFYPNGKSGVTNENLLYLQLDPTSKRTTVFAEFKLSVFFENESDVLERESSYKSNIVRQFKAELHQGWGFSNLIGNNMESQFVRRIIFYCEIKYCVGAADSFTNNVTEFCLSEDLRRLFRNEEFTDVVISVKGREYRAHKIILVARSPVFAAMFSHVDMKESQQNRIEITDFDESVVEEILNYLYTGKPKNLENMAIDLLAAADKYGLDGLKNICERSLVEKLSVENAMDTLIFADFYNAFKLKSVSVNYIVLNSKEVMKRQLGKISPYRIRIYLRKYAKAFLTSDRMKTVSKKSSNQ